MRELKPGISALTEDYSYDDNGYKQGSSNGSSNRFYPSSNSESRNDNDSNPNNGSFFSSGLFSDFVNPFFSFPEEKESQGGGRKTSQRSERKTHEGSRKKAPKGCVQITPEESVKITYGRQSRSKFLSDSSGVSVKSGTPSLALASPLMVTDSSSVSAAATVNGTRARLSEQRKRRVEPEQRKQRRVESERQEEQPMVAKDSMGFEDEALAACGMLYWLQGRNPKNPTSEKEDVEMMKPRNPLMERPGIEWWNSQAAEELIERCMLTYDWNREYATDVLQGYFQFLQVKKNMQEWDAPELVPSVPIDLMWQQHILDVCNYVHDISQVCGRVIGREMACFDELSDDVKFQRIKATKIALRACYGDNLDSKIWDFGPEYTDDVLFGEKAVVIDVTDNSTMTLGEEQSSKMATRDDTSTQMDLGRPKLVGLDAGMLEAEGMLQAEAEYMMQPKKTSKSDSCYCLESYDRFFTKMGLDPTEPPEYPDTSFSKNSLLCNASRSDFDEPDLRLYP